VGYGQSSRPLAGHFLVGEAGQVVASSPTELLVYQMWAIAEAPEWVAEVAEGDELVAVAVAVVVAVEGQRTQLVNSLLMLRPVPMKRPLSIR
jgi:hypothetical protein